MSYLDKKTGETTFKLGFHVSIAGGIDKAVDRAIELGCTTFQIFTRNPRSWAFKSLDPTLSQMFIEKRKNAKIDPIFAHMPYLANLSSPETEIYQKSVQALIEELKRCTALNIPFLVTHCGSHKGQGFEVGLIQISNALEEGYKQSRSKTQMLLENTGGGKANMGNSFKDLKKIIDSLDKSTAKMIGICFDTCHAFVSGYELRTSEAIDALMNEVAEIGVEKLKLIHANDAKYKKGSHRDRHEHIGEGYIGLKGFRAILHDPVLRKLPLILETPRRSEKDDVKNLLTMRKLLQTTNKKNNEL